MPSAVPRCAWVALASLVVAACGPPRSIDGSGNNRSHPAWGPAGGTLLRSMPPDYGDGSSSLAGAARPSPRAISNAVCDQQTSLPNTLGAGDFIWQWGQFLDHDIDLTPEVDPAEPEPIPAAAGGRDPSRWRFSDIIRANTTIGAELQANVFRVP